MGNCITLYTPCKPKRYDNRPGVIRVTPEAEQVLKQLAAESGLSVCKVASEMILQGSRFVQIVEED